MLLHYYVTESDKNTSYGKLTIGEQSPVLGHVIVVLLPHKGVKIFLWLTTDIGHNDIAIEHCYLTEYRTINRGSESSVQRVAGSR